MYTQCPDCTTVFRVSAAVLRAAQGDVRCGVCSTTFNALENLSEKPFKPGPPGIPTLSPDDSMTVEELPGSEDIELSSEEPEPAPPMPAAPKAAATKAPAPKAAAPKPPTPKPVAPKAVAPKPEALELQAAEAVTVSAEDQALEFHGSAADLDRLFVELPSAEVPQFTEITLAGGDAERTDEFPILVLDEKDEPESEPEVEEIVLEGPKEPDGPDSMETPRFVIPDEMRKGLLAEAAARSTTAVDFDDDVGPAVPRRWAWNLAAGLMLLLLVVQVVHSQRDQLIRRPGIGPVLAQSYAILGLPFAMPTDLAAFELRQLGAASDTTGAGQLLLRASIVNRASFSQPFPLLRLALQDRFGSTLFVRDIEPADYLPREGTPRLLAPGGRADAEIRIVDPGKDAVGFEMDVCLPADGGVRCANQLAAAAP